MNLKFLVRPERNDSDNAMTRIYREDLENNSLSFAPLHNLIILNFNERNYPLKKFYVQFLISRRETWLIEF